MADILHKLWVNAPVEEVYKALTTQDGLRNWWTPEAWAEPVSGSIAEFRFGERWHDKMEIVLLEPNQRIVWRCIQCNDEWLNTEISFFLETVGWRTLVHFSHTGWKGPTDFFAHCNYHWGYYMHSLKLLCETGSGMPFEAEPVG